MQTSGWLQLGLFVLVLTAITKPMGLYLMRVLDANGRTWLDLVLKPLERLTYRVMAVDSSREHDWKQYTFAMLLFSLVSCLFTYAILRLQHLLPPNPQGLGPLSSHLAFNTAVSFTTNTNWQSYVGESTMSYLSQLVGLTLHNFVSAATGIAIAAALVRGIARHSAKTLGNFWVDLVRVTYYLLLPICVVFAVFLVSQGMIQNFKPYSKAKLMESYTIQVPKMDEKGQPVTTNIAVTVQTPKLDSQGKPLLENGVAVMMDVPRLDEKGQPVMTNAPVMIDQKVDEQSIVQGPMASQVAIKMLGTNGGGYVNANAAHPFENPTPLSNFLQMLSILAIGSGLTYYLGRMVKNQGHGWTVWAVMMAVFIAGTVACWWAETAGNPIHQKLGIALADGNMEGKEVRFGIFNSALFATITTDASCGAVNSMHDSFTALGGLIPLFNIQLGEIANGLLRVAQVRNVTQIIVGKPGGVGLLEWWRNGRLMRRLMQRTGEIDLYVVRAEKKTSEKPVRRPLTIHRSTVNQYGAASTVVLLSALINYFLLPITGPRVPGMLFLLVVILLALFVGRGPVFLAATLSALAWNFFFLPPRFTLIIQKPEDALLFGTYFVVALVLGQLVARIRTQAEAERRREERTSALYELTCDLAEAGSRDEVVWQLVGQVNRVFAAPAAVVLQIRDKLELHPDSPLELTEKDLSVADWAFRQRKAAGRFTDNLPGASALHLPLATQRKAFGVLAINLPLENLQLSQRDLLEAFARQGALVLDRIELRATAEQSRLIAESERLSRIILNSISHELRTPLAAITSAASALAEAAEAPVGHRRELLNEIQEANTRLNRIVGNLLDVARLESGKVVPRFDWHDARDLVQTTLRQIQGTLGDYPVKVDLPAEPMLAKLDFSLTQHALSNLLVNAAMHTPSGTPIEISARFAEKNLLLSVGDRGPGIPPEVLPRIFEKFFRGPHAPAGGSGLGLTIAKGFVEAQGGTITAANRPGGGAIFTLSMEQKEPVPLTTHA